MHSIDKRVINASPGSTTLAALEYIVDYSSCMLQEGQLWFVDASLLVKAD